jgi:hypothetical protein
MPSVFQRALGRDFGRLHPEMRHRFGVSIDHGESCVGTGVMDRVWHGAAFTRPFLVLGARRNILLPDTGRHVPFTIENHPYLDSHGREAVTFARTFQFPGRLRRFDATMIYSPSRGCVVDFLGTHHHLAADLLLQADGQGGLVIRTAGFRLYEGPLAIKVPRLAAGEATVHEYFDEQAGQFRVKVHVKNRWLGPLFGYHGTFTARYHRAAAPPAAVMPRRERARC